MRNLLQDEQLVDNPLDRLEFLGDERKNMTLVSQRLEKAEEDGRRWLDYHLTIRYRDLPDAVDMLIRVDRETKLPRLALRGRHDGAWRRMGPVRPAPLQVEPLVTP